MTYTKLFSSITESTIWMEDNPTRLVWIAMLAMADKHGRVWGSMPGLANRARVEQHECEAALQKFLSPDKHSRTPDNEGRRIEIIRGGWRLLNHGYYRDLQDTESQKAYKAAWIREKRKRDREAKRLGVDQNVDKVDKSRLMSKKVDDIAEAEAEAEASLTPHPARTTVKNRTLKELIAYGKSPHCGATEVETRAMWDNYEMKGWMIKDGVPVDDREAALRNWMNNERKTHGQRNHTGRGGNETTTTGERTSARAGTGKIRRNFESPTDERRRIKGDECREEGITIPVIRVEPIPTGVVPGSSQVP